MRRCRGVLERLTPREFQVMRLVITGLLNRRGEKAEVPPLVRPTTKVS